MFIDCQKYADEVKAGTMVHGVNVGDVRATHCDSITDPIHSLPTDSPSSARVSVYMLYFLPMSYSSSCVS